MHHPHMQLAGVPENVARNMEQMVPEYKIKHWSVVARLRLTIPVGREVMNYYCPGAGFDESN